MQETWVQSLGQEDPLEKELTTHSSIFAWEIPWTGVPDRPHSIGSQSQTCLRDRAYTYMPKYERKRGLFIGNLEVHEILAADV